MSFAVTAFGSCRVLVPFRILKLQDRVVRNQTGMYGATHTSKEALQVLRAMAGELILPPEIRPFIMTHPAENMDDPAKRLNDLSETDILVIELSSVKEVVFRDLYLQLVLTRRRLWAATQSQAVRKWWVAMQHDGTDIEDRAALLGDDDLPPAEAAVVREAFVRMQEAESIRSDMEAIGEYFAGPILFVTHFDIPKPQSGRNVFGRAELIAAVSEAGAELGHRVYDPSADVLAYAAEHGGPAAAITDMGHYTEAFMKDSLSDRIHAEALAAMDMARVR